jgi:16S rRNA (cytosine967-C5)-methyltransferase
VELSEPAPGLPARACALAVLSDVLRRKRPLDSAVAERFAAATLSPRDAAFARAIASESLRRFGQLEALIRHFVPKAPPPHKAGCTLEILIAGACELLFLKVAPHAAVDAANRLAQADPKAVHFKGLINAELRRVAKDRPGLVGQQDSAALNVPDWLWERWLAHYGAETARAIAAAHLAVPGLDLTLREDGPYTDLAMVVQLAPRRLRLWQAGRVEDLAGFAAGRWWVQDFAASLPVQLLGDVAGQSAIDLCAAPGGKTLQLTSIGARVTAVDVSLERLALVQANLARVNLQAETVAADARDFKPAAPARVVLLDAPCTATGTIRRHPDVPWLKSAADIAICESLQRDLLDAAAGMTAPGGVLVYAVCSLEPEEGIEQITAFLRRRKDFQRVPITALEIFDAAFVSPEGDLRTLPCHWADKGGMDGFYAARLGRVA